jgi:hypothetical protein
MKYELILMQSCPEGLPTHATEASDLGATHAQLSQHSYTASHAAIPYNPESDCPAIFAAGASASPPHWRTAPAAISLITISAVLFMASISGCVALCMMHTKACAKASSTSGPQPSGPSAASDAQKGGLPCEAVGAALPGRQASREGWELEELPGALMRSGSDTSPACIPLPRARSI